MSNSSLTKFARSIATLGPIGSWQARGTIATTLTLLVLYELGSAGMRTGALLWAIVPLVGFGLLIIQKALTTFKQTQEATQSPVRPPIPFDPPEIVLDEVLGFTLAMSIFPLTIPWLASGFVIFRLFDIFKPLGIARLEFLPGAAGIISDDLLAGFYTQIVLVVGRIGIELCFGC